MRLTKGCYGVLVVVVDASVVVVEGIVVVVVEVVLVDVLLVVGAIVVVVVGGTGFARTKLEPAAKFTLARDNGVLVHPPNKARCSVADAVKPLNWPAVTVPVSCGDSIEDDLCGHVSVTARVDGFPFLHLIVAVPFVVLGNPLNATIRQFVVVGDVTVSARLPKTPAGPVHVFTFMPPFTVVIFNGTRLVPGYFGSGGWKNAEPTSCRHVSPVVAPPEGATNATSPTVTATPTTTAILRRMCSSQSHSAAKC